MLIIFGLFLVLHGLVHLLYAGQSSRLFELRPDMTWPDGAVIPSKIFREKILRKLTSLLLVMAAIGFVASGTGLILRQAWWQMLTAGSAVFSSLIFLLFWDGQLKRLDEKGGIGILINLAVLVISCFLR